jgi:transposase
MLSRWRKEYRDGKLHNDGQKRVYVNKNTKKTNKREMTENARLKKENEQLKLEIDLLKKWQRFLAEQHQEDLDSSKETEK